MLAKDNCLTGWKNEQSDQSGAWEAGVKVAAAYPGTPSTEIMENLSRFPAEDLHAQWSVNEKTVLDVAIGGSFAGVRSFAVMKHVGLNVAADALMSFSYIGVNAGLAIVVEELEPVVENALKVMGLEVEGKSLFARGGEFSPAIVRDGFVKAGLLEEKIRKNAFDFAPMIRPPVLCAGCPHTSCFMALRALDTRVAGDIGCYTLAVVEPLKSMDTTVSMGSSIANAVGMAKAGTETKPIVATIGDSTFLHSGIPPLIDAVYNNANITVFLLDNHITAMTGGQDHPGTGKTLRGEDTARVDFVKLIKALGVEWVETVDSYDMASMYQSLREAVEFKGVSVVISDRPCVLDPQKIKGAPFRVDQEKCVACQSCMNLGCPALSWSSGWHDGRHKVEIDPQSCMGCSICAQICPTDSITL